MIGEIRLGFFVEGIGYHKDCSKLIHKIDSSSKLKHIVEGTILEVDEDLYKVQSVELGFIPSPGRSGFHREKPIKVIYVSKAHTELMGAKSKAAAIATKKLAPAEVRGELKESTIADDKSYGEPEFTEEFPHLIEKPKRTRRKKAEAKKEKKEVGIKPRKIKKIKEKTRPKIKDRIRGQNTVGVILDEAAFISEGKIKKGGVNLKPTRKRPSPPKGQAPVPKKKAAPDKPEKKTRRKRCKGCGGLFKSIGRHKCKTK